MYNQYRAANRTISSAKEPRLGTAYKMEPTTGNPNLRHHSRENLQGGGWQVILKMDCQELNGKAQESNRNRMISTIKQRLRAAFTTVNTQWEFVESEKALHAADYLWIARRKTMDGGYEERVLDFCVERKSFNDLGRSLTKCNETCPKITRMETQMRKMYHCGIQHRMILVESRQRYYQPGEQKSKAASTFVEELEGNLHEGFSVQETSGIDETIEFLIEQHLRLQRELPLASVNTFAELENCVNNAMNCPKFRFYCQLLSIYGVNEKTALAVLSHCQSEVALRDTLRRHPSFLGALKTPGGRSISGKAQEALLLRFGSQRNANTNLSTTILMAQNYPTRNSNYRNSTIEGQASLSGDERNKRYKSSRETVHSPRMLAGLANSINTNDNNRKVHSHGRFISSQALGTVDSPIIIDDHSGAAIGNTTNSTIDVPGNRKKPRFAATWSCAHCSFVNTEEVMYCTRCNISCISDLI